MSAADKTGQATAHPATVDPPLITGGQTFGSISDKISRITESKTTVTWLALFGMAGSIALVLLGS
ncbi:hypothetical protein GF377_08900, partial [candidate division GN15 bacterium]|nr:hypothetical protein [candidate division GN15 bacterium]